MENKLNKRNKLIEDNIKLYYSFINSQKSKGYHPQLLEDIEYRCLCGFINACDKFDPEHDTGAKFQTLAWTAMDRMRINAITSNNTLKRKVNSLTNSIEEQEESLSLEDIKKNITPTENFYFDESHILFNKINDMLTDDEKELVDLYIYQGLTHKEIGKLKGYSGAYSQYLFSNIINRIKEELREGYL